MDEEKTQDIPEDEKVKWYVMGAIFRKEVKIRDDMRQHGFNCYVPMKYEVKTVGRKKDRKLVPAVRELLFVHSSKNAIMEFKTFGTRDILYFKTDRKSTRELMVVPDKEMEDFIRVTQHVEENLTYFRPEEIKLQVGDKIKVHGGVFDGVEGVLMRLPGKRSKQLVVSIPGVSAVAVSLSPDVVEVVDKPTKKSTDIEGDMKTLFTLSFEKLFAPPDRYKQEYEYNILVSELRQTLGRMESVKGYTSAREAEIALSVYMATKAIGKNADSATDRMVAAIGALKDTSMLKLRLKLYMAILAPDDELLEDIRAKVKEWPKTQLSEQQRKFVEEMKKVLISSQPAGQEVKKNEVHP